MHRFKSLTLLLGCLLAVGGCAAPIPGPGTAECALPGDIDCNPDALGGKADAWDQRNNPSRLSRSLNYRIDELPLEGRHDGDVWAASYWPTAEGSTNKRWQGATTLSPLEKYDNAFNDWSPDPESEYMTSVPSDCGENAKDEYGAYRDWLGPAARWQSGAQGRDRMFDGVDSDDDGEADECSWEDKDGIEGWWGLCHAWSPAAILEPEPLHAVEYNGQRFEVSDIKALILTVYDGTESLFLGGRCNAREFEHDDNHRISQSECRDVNAGAWHVVVTNFLGINQRGFVEDRTAGFQVWNQPLTAYEVTHQEEIDLARAHELLEIETPEGEEPPTEYAFNADATRFFEVRMTTDYLVEGHQSTQPLGQEGYIRHDSYHYILEVNDEGKVIGGEWLGGSRDNHPDFLWVPLRPITRGWGRRSNPHVDYEMVKELIRLSRETEEPGGGEEPPAEGLSFSFEGEVAIPDNNTNGATATIEIDEAFEIGDLSILVDVEHTYIGDLVIELSHGDTRVTLHDRDGGGTDDLLETYTVSDFAGAASEGTWTLRVTDNANVDTGTIRKFSLTFTR